MKLNRRVLWLLVPLIIGLLFNNSNQASLNAATPDATQNATMNATTLATMSAATMPATMNPTMNATTPATKSATMLATVAPTPVPTTYITSGLTAPFAYGVASGDMTADSVVLWTRTPSAQSVTPELSLDAAFTSPTDLTPVQSTDTTDFTVKVIANGLKAGTLYYFRFKAGSDISPVGTFKTAYAADQNATVTMAFTGDADWKWKPYPTMAGLAKENLDYFLFLGDLLYETTNLAGTTSVEDLNGYRFKYRENREPRDNSASQMVPMRDVYANFGQYSIVDNHETGLSKADKTAPSYNEGGASANGGFVNQTAGFKARIEAYEEYQPVLDQQVTGTGDPRSDQTRKLYGAVSWGANQELITLDDRTYRDSRLKTSDDPAAISCSRTMLGAPQLKWFEDELLSAQKRDVVWKTIVVSSPIQELGRASQIGADLDGTKSWEGGYECERDTILKFIDGNAINNVVFLTTDNHYTVINNLKYYSVPGDMTSALKPARNALEILTGPLGAGTGLPNGIKVDVKGLSIRDADAKILGVWNGDAANTDGATKGLKQAGLDPIGLESDFPGLDLSSLQTPGSVAPSNFASFQTFSYAILTFDKTSLHVQVKGLPYVADPAVLLNADAEKEYESRQVAEILSFTIKAQ